MGGYPEKAWSGTYWSLHEAFKRQGVEINECPIEEVFAHKKYLWQKVLHKLGLYTYRRELWYKEVMNGRRQYSYLQTGEKKIAFQFSEYVVDTPSLDTYIYLDIGVPSVIALNNKDSIFRKFSGYGVADPKELSMRAQLQADYFQHCKGIFTMGSWLRDRLVNEEGIPAERVHHVGAGVNMHTELINDSHKEHRRLLFVGRDFRRKGGYVVYEAFKLLRKRMPEAELYVAGPVKDPIAEPIDGYHFIGDQPYDKVAELYNRCDVFCMPSYFEAYGLVFIEALTFGLPCIGRNAWEMSHFIEDGKIGYLIDDDNPEVLAQRMYDAVHNEAMQKEVCSRRNQYIQDYSWDSVAKRMIEIIEKS